ncbi:hypothetical protein AVEN_88757-1 [Araneus ventricosus]|uniref:Uncharacterized protein n=1 Tax=Araneus ventricosus TaxID=182803 RepID=A0A4Y2RKV8_ARAVE|nr:hypothetical protein AVEN_88757-1 [Araneus ventricosus]
MLEFDGRKSPYELFNTILFGFFHRLSVCRSLSEQLTHQSFLHRDVQFFGSVSLYEIHLFFWAGAAAFIQAKFCSLRSYFQKEDRKTKANSGAAAFDFVPKWVHYRQLLFLKDCSMVAPSDSSLDTSIIEDESESTLTVSTIRII